MGLQFDISEDEAPVFFAETSEQLQALDAGLVRLETDPGEELLQSLFRAAHTLKGAAGLINHKRMVNLTHALESVLDGLRKEQIPVQPELIDACLEAVDALRQLVDEVRLGEPSLVEVDELAARLSGFTAPGQKAPGTAAQPAGELQTGPSDSEDYTGSGRLVVRAVISPDSIASAARAFQVMMTLQEMGEIIEMQPTLEQIETAQPVSEFRAVLEPTQPVDEIRRALQMISEIDELQIGAERLAVSQPSPAQHVSEKKIGRIGDVLVQNGLITEEQLQAALKEQERSSGPASLLGQTLIRMGFISQEVLDQVLADQQANRQTAKTQEVPPEEKARLTAAEKTIRTSVERLDTLMNLVGELITDRNRLNMIRGEMEARFHGDPQVDALSETIAHVGRITDQLQAEVMSIRMLPISNVFNKFPRLVRDLARKANKQVDLVIRGEDTELDRSVIEEIGDPLIHLLRNAVDHGIETPEERKAAGKNARGTILLTARHEQGRIILTVEDDGRGIDVERVRAKAVERGLLSARDAAGLSREEAIDLIFAPGLSTAQKISDISGRGVGMDIVRANIERLNGNITIETWPGRGTQFLITLPLTLAIVPSLLVKVERGIYAIPMVTVTETLRIRGAEIKSVNQRPVISLREHVLPLLSLREVFGLNGSKRNGRHARNSGFAQDEWLYIVVVRVGKNQAGLIVDSLVGEQEVVVKALGPVVGDIPEISSAAILGDGQVALIVDTQGILKQAGSNG